MRQQRPSRRVFSALLAGALTLGGVVQPVGAALAQAAGPELENLALGQEVSASGSETDHFAPERAVDGLVGLVGGEDRRDDFAWRDTSDNFRNREASRWSSNTEGERWLSVDLGQEVVVDHVTVVWGKQYGKTYRIETSLDGTDWTVAADNVHATASEEDTTALDDAVARYVRVTITEANDTWATGVWELEVWGTPRPADPVNLATLDTTKVTASGQEVAGQWGPELAADGKVGLVSDTTWRDKAWLTTRENHVNAQASRWSANNADGAWLAFDLGAEANIASVSVVWGKQYGKPYQIETSSDGQSWTPVATDLNGADSETVTTELTGVTARHVRISVTKRSSRYAPSIWEVQIMGTWADGAPEPEPEPESGELPSVVPEPVSYEAQDGEPFVLDPASDIVADDAARDEAEKLAETLRASTGYELDVVGVSDDDVADIVLTMLDEGSAADLAGHTDEGYVITSSEEGLVLGACTAEGLFNGVQTTYQLFGPYSVADFETNGPWSVPALSITDYPRYEWRGIMLDPARSFLTVEEVKQALDVMSMYKLNVLHLHLVDDQGWRIEITNEGRAEGDTIDYTRLATIAGDAAMGTTQWQQLPGIRGYYTQDDLREIVAYANARHIDVVPEIDMPGHSGGMLHAIPQLNSAESSHDGTVDPATGEKINNPEEWICGPAQTTGDVGNSYLDINNEYTWMFLEHVVRQVSEICGSDYLHIGGDETHQLNTDYPGRAVEFLNRAADMVRDMGLTPIGWNEWASTGSGVEFEPGDTLQCWNGNAPQKVRDADAKIIWSMAQNAYFPQAPGPNVAGPTWAGGSDGVVNIDDFYNYDPATSAQLDDSYIRGVEGAMWSEHVRGIQDFFFPSFPRAMALAEVAWTPQAKRSGQVADLRERLADTVPALTMKGADFYAEDGLANEPLVAATDLETAPTVGVSHTIARGYLPMTTADNVSATITWEDGQTQELTVVQRRPYLAPTNQNNNNRAQNGLWELVLTELPAAGTHTGTVTFTAGGISVTDTLTVTVTEGAVAYGNNTSLSAASGRQGDTVTATLTDFEPNSSVSLSLGEKNLGTATVGADGTGSLEFSVPAVAPGTYEVTTSPATANDVPTFEVEPAFTPVVTVSHAKAKPGMEVTVSVTGLEPGKEATLATGFGEDVTLQVSDEGTAEATLTIPEDATLGSYELTVTQGWWTGSATLELAAQALAHPIAQDLYAIAGFSTEETTGEGASNGRAEDAIDGDLSTYWHTAWSSGTSSLPAYVTIDLGKSYDVDGLSYTPRQSNQNGLIKDYEIYVTEENPAGVPTGIPAASGTFPNVLQAGSRDATIVELAEPATGRYVTLVAKSTLAGNAFAGAAELVVSGLASEEPTPEPEPVDTAELEAALEEAAAADRDGKTEESLAALDAAVAAGESLLDSDELTEEAVAEAAQAIRDAIAGLEDIPEPVEPTLEGVSVKAGPAKTAYTVGDELDATGLVLALSYSDGSTKEIAYADAPEDFSFDVTTLEAAGTVEVTVTYGGKTATFAVTVTEPVVEPDPAEEAREKLQAAVDAHDDLTAEDYTAETWEPFAEALEAAQDLLAREDATADELTAAAEALEAAAAALEPATGEEPGGEEQPGGDEPGGSTTQPGGSTTQPGGGTTRPGGSEEPGGTTQPGGSHGTATVPETGDPSLAAGLVATVGAAVSGLGVVFGARRRR